MKLTILLVEDDENDTALARAAFRMLDGRFDLQTVSDGHAALAYLSGSAPYDDRARFPLPALVLLDLTMPGMDGYAVLKWIRSRQFGRLPVLVLAGTCLSPDIQRAYAAGANSFIIKPGDALQLARELRGSLGYWLPAAPEPAAGPLSPPAGTPPARSAAKPAAKSARSPFIAQRSTR